MMAENGSIENARKRGQFKKEGFFFAWEKESVVYTLLQNIKTYN